MSAISKKKAFLEAFKTSCSLTAAAKAVKIERGMHYRWLEKDRKYRAEYERAKDEAAQTLEDEAVKRANEGWLEPVFYKGQAVGGIRRFSDGLLMFLLRGMRPDKYRERQMIEHGGSLSLQVLDDLLDKTMAEKRALKDGKK